MRLTRPAVSVILPVYNGRSTVLDVARSVINQDYPDIELVISDNASDDGTDEVCRELARDDARVVYHRREENVGLLRNFSESVQLARGRYIRWIGDTDWIAPTYVSRCLDALGSDDRLVLVTTQVDYVEPDGRTTSCRYDGHALGDDDPVTRFGEMLRLQTLNYALMDPLYGLIRHEVAVALPRRRMLREDEIFAAELALAGPWGHIPEVLARRQFDPQTLPQIARKIGSPVWHSKVSTVLQCRELHRIVAQQAAESALSRDQATRARAEIWHLCIRRAMALAARARRKAVRVSGPRVRRTTSPDLG